MDLMSDFSQQASRVNLIPKLSFENDVPRVPSKGELDEKISRLMSHSEKVTHILKAERLSNS